jgi:hypothetical protein
VVYSRYTYPFQQWNSHPTDEFMLLAHNERRLH